MQWSISISYNGIDFVGADPKELLAGQVAPAIHGRLPHWSGRKKYQISEATGLYPGNFAVLYASDPHPQSAKNPKADIVVVMQKRTDKGPYGEDRFGMLGGYASVDDNPEKNRKKEQPDEACAREIGEESVDDKGRPVLNPHPQRLADVLHHGYDYRNEPATTFTGYLLELTPNELTAIQAHSKRMQSDLEYAAAVKERSKGRVSLILVRPLREVLAMGREQFTHPHEFEAIQKLANRPDENAY